MCCIAVAQISLWLSLCPSVLYKYGISVLTDLLVDGQKKGKKRGKRTKNLRGGGEEGGREGGS